MRKARVEHRMTPEERLEASDRSTSSLAGLAAVLALLVLGLFLIQKLKQVETIQDCVMSGRTNCAPIYPDRP